MTDTTAPLTAAPEPPETFGTRRHANDPETPVLRVLACTKCGDRHTVDVAEVQREAIEPLLALVRAALAVESGKHSRQASGAYCACPLHQNYRLALAALDPEIVAAARKPE